jgi:membrane-bound lytic murein transglycosylase B
MASALRCFLCLFISVLAWSGYSPALPPSLAADLVTDGQVIDLGSERYRALFADLIHTHHFNQQELDRLFAGVTIKKRVLELMDTQWEAKPYHQYYPLFVNDALIEGGQKRLQEHRALLAQIERRFGVDREVVIAIWGIETHFGANQGGFNVFQTLNTLFAAYPRRSDFFRNQLIDFLLLCRENHVQPHQVEGSYAGAFGQTQFIPSSFRSYGVSFDGDNDVDVWQSTPDILASIANYLKQFGWTLDGPLYADIGSTLSDPVLIAAYHQGRTGRVPLARVAASQGIVLPPSPAGPVSIVGLELAPGGDHAMRYIAGYPNFQAITQWNHSNRYAMAVSQLAEALAVP